MAAGASPVSSAIAPVYVMDIDQKIADAAGVGPNAVEINDMAVHPSTHEIYISATRIGGHGTKPLIVRVGQDGAIELLDLTDTSVTMQPLTHFPDQETTFRPRGLGNQPASARDLAKGDIPLSSLAIMDIE